MQYEPVDLIAEANCEYVSIFSVYGVHIALCMERNRFHTSVCRLQSFQELNFLNNRFSCNFFAQETVNKSKIISEIINNTFSCYLLNIKVAIIFPKKRCQADKKAIELLWELIK